MNLYCYVCEHSYISKQAYNDHLSRKTHKIQFTNQFMFYQGLLENNADSVDKIKEYINKIEISNKTKKLL